MKIRIDDRTSAAAALGEINGRATAHTAEPWHVFDEKDAAEKHLAALGIAKRDRVGAMREFISGGAVSNAYAKKNWGGRAATRVMLLRGATHWYMTLAERSTIGQGGGYSRTWLTTAQRDIALDKFRAEFGVLAPALAAAA